MLMPRWLVLVLVAAQAGSACGAASSSRNPEKSRSRRAAALQPAETEAQTDARLAQKLIPVSQYPDRQAEMCLEIAWNPEEPDAALRAAALRRLRGIDPRVVAETIAARINGAIAPVRIGMLDLAGEIYPRLGGVHSFLDMALAEQIRHPSEEVAAKAISVCSALRIKDAYLPMRELASQPDSPLRSRAIEGIAALRDPRATGFFTKLLNSDSVPREQVYRALGVLGRPAALLLKSKLEAPSVEERRLALETLLPMAMAEDLSSLYVYIQKYPPEGDLKTRIYDTIADLEARQSERSLAGD